MPPPYQWAVHANHFAFRIHDAAAGNVFPFMIFPNARQNSLVVTPLGRIGMGTDVPVKQLHLKNDDTTTIRLHQQGSDFPEQIWDIEGDEQSLRFRNATVDRTTFSLHAGAPHNSLIVASSGSVGVGTSAPNFVGSSTFLPGRFLNVKADGNTLLTGVANGVFQGQLGAQNHFAHLGAPANQRIMRLQTSSGFTGFHALNDALNAYTIPNILMMKMSNGFIGFGVQNPQHPLHLASGARCTAAGVWTNASSRELKEDIAPISSEQALDTVRKLEPVSYRYKSETDEQYTGFIAEDVPELVAMNDRKSLAAMDITAVLTRVVKDQQSKLETQESQLTEQQERLTTQQQKLAEQQNKLEKYETTVSELLRRLEVVERSTSKTNP